MLIAGIAIIAFSTAGIARMMGWGLDTAGYSGIILALDHAAAVPASEARAKRCPECGMVMSMREIEGHDEGAPGSYEFVVRMADGSMRLIEDANPGRWRTGERLIIIDGARPPE